MKKKGRFRRNEWMMSEVSRKYLKSPTRKKIEEVKQGR